MIIALLLTIRLASYALQSSSGAPLVTAGRIDTANVRTLAAFDVVTLEATPWAEDVTGSPRPDVPLYLRRLNPRIQLYLYLLAGDQWLPPSFVPQPWDHSGFRAVFDAVNAGNGWLYGTDGALWLQNYRVNLADRATCDRLGDVYERFVSTHLFDGVFLDCCSTSIAWTNNGQRKLDFARAGFASLAAMDSARWQNVSRLIDRLRRAGGCGFRVAVNGTGPAPRGQSIDFREGLGSLISIADAKAWMATPGTHWLKAECSPCEGTKALLREIAQLGDAILSCGPDRSWPPVLP